jgi:beclin 1
MEMDKPPDSSALATFSADYMLPTHLSEAHRKRELSAINQLEQSYIVVSGSNNRGTQKPEAQSANVERQYKALTAFFEIASDKTQLDHPLCMGCSDGVFAELEKKLRDLEQDKDRYRAHLQNLQSAKAAAQLSSAPPPPPKPDEREVKARTQQLEEKLRAIRAERALVLEETAKLSQESKQLAEFEAKFAAAHLEFELEFSIANKDHKVGMERIKNLTTELERLKKINVYDDAFYISHDGHFATINGFRLGRLTSQPIDWQENNAALGQVVLLLHLLAKHCGYTYQQARLIPLGSFSRIAKGDEINELFGHSNEFVLGRLFWFRRFDNALVWLLGCVKELADHAKSIDPKFELPYAIDGPNINKVPIKPQFNPDTVWTKAMKYMLIDIKKLLGWVTKQYG